jgi:hypothetical protein
MTSRHDTSTSIHQNRGPEKLKYANQIGGKAGNFGALAPDGGVEIPIASMDSGY